MPREIRGENKQESRCIIICAGAGGKGGSVNTDFLLHCTITGSCIFPNYYFCQSLHCFVLVKKGLEGKSRKLLVLFSFYRISRLIFLFYNYSKVMVRL